MEGRESDRDDTAASRRQIVVRGAVVAGLIVVLLAGLLIFEKERKSTESPAPSPSGHAIAPIGNVVSTHSAPALSDDLKQAIRDAPDVTQTALASMSGPAAEPETPSFDPAVPLTHEPAPHDREAPPLPVKRQAPPSVQSGVQAPPPPPHPSRAGDRLMIETVKTPGPPPQPTNATKMETVVPPPLAMPVMPAMPRLIGYVVQLGVFNNRSNAEELRSKLALAGIPSQVETRIQLGPFASREEALKAQQTLKTLGMAPGLLVPPRKP